MIVREILRLPQDLLECSYVAVSIDQGRLPYEICLCIPYIVPTDFTAIVDRTVTFQPSETQRQVQVVIEDDDILENTEDFTGLLSLPASSDGVALGSATTATATIIDNDGKSYISD